MSGTPAGAKFAAVAVAVVATAALATVVPRGPASGGPFDGADPVLWCAPAWDGVVTWGSHALTNDSVEPVTVEAVSVATVDPGARVAEVWLAPIHNRTLVGLRPGWALPDDAHAVEGTVIPRGESVNLLIRVDVLEDRDVTLEGIEVTYRAGGRLFRDRIPTTLTLTSRESC